MSSFFSFLLAKKPFFLGAPLAALFLLLDFDGAALFPLVELLALPFVALPFLVDFRVLVDERLAVAVG